MAAMQNLVPTQPVVPDFAPVPRKYRYDGWTAERQRAFIHALAETGSVKAAAKRINMSAEGAYYLRRQRGADGFRTAWEAALTHGVQRLTDIAIERALEGVPVPIFWRRAGRRETLVQRSPADVHPQTPSARALWQQRPARRHEASRHAGARGSGELPVCRARAAAEQDTAAAEAAHATQIETFLEDMLTRYAAKVRAERHYRLTGQIVAADYTVRQLTHIELILDMGGVAMERIDQWTQRPRKPPATMHTQLFASPMSERLDTLRRAVWAEAGEPARPKLTFPETAPGTHRWGGPTIFERDKAQREAEAAMAEAQKKWEAAATEEGWEAWKAGRGA